MGHVNTENEKISRGIGGVKKRRNALKSKERVERNLNTDDGGIGGVCVGGCGCGCRCVCVCGGGSVRKQKTDYQNNGIQKLERCGKRGNVW